MADPIRIIIASRSSSVLERLQQAVGQNDDYKASARLIVNGHADPLEGLTQLPDILVLAVSDNSITELEAHFRRDPASRCPLIVVSASLDPAVMRLAMQAGARDFLTEPVANADLISAITHIAAERRPAGDRTQRTKRSAVFVNASGGSGATFLASNIAHMLRTNSHRETVLVDLDLQFGPVPHYFDVQPKRDLIQALSVAAELDRVALEGYLTPHHSGLQILSTLPSSDMPSRENVGEQVRALSRQLTAHFEHIVFDVPNQLDLPGIIALEQASDIVIVMQQTLPSLRNAVRLLGLLRDALSIPSERVILAVNRYRKGSSVSYADIERAVEGLRIACIPNHYQSVSESIAMGEPIFDHARSSPVVRPLLELEEILGGNGITHNRSLFSKTLHSLIGS